MKFRSLTIMAGVLASVAVAGAANAAEKLKFAHVYETSMPYHANAVWAAEQIKSRTNGRYEIDVFPASALGKETDINQGLALGTVDIIYTGNTFAARYYGPIGIGSAPFVFRGFDHWTAYSKSDLLKDLGKGYRKATGNQITAITYYGQRHVTSNTPINTPADMKGLKIRVPNAPLYMMFPKSVGANPTPLAFAEVYLALQQGTVDAQENPLPTIEAKKFYEVQKYINLTGHLTESLLTIVGGPLWNRLDDADKVIFNEVLAEAAARSTKSIRDAELALATDFKDKYGKTVIKVDRKPFMDAVLPALSGKDASWAPEHLKRLQAIK